MNIAAQSSLQQRWIQGVIGVVRLSYTSVADTKIDCLNVYIKFS